MLLTERLVVRDLPPAAAIKVSRFHAENWHAHRRWEAYRSNEFFTVPMQRRILRIQRRTPSLLHLWLLKREGQSRGWRQLTLVGSLTVSSIQRANQDSCLIGYKMDARHMRRGYMREGLVAALGYLFNELELHRVEASVMPSNLASLRLLEGLGFRREGLARGLLRVQGSWEDHLRLALLRDEWNHKTSDRA